MSGAVACEECSQGIHGIPSEPHYLLLHCSHLVALHITGFPARLFFLLSSCQIIQHLGCALTHPGNPRPNQGQEESTGHAALQHAASTQLNPTPSLQLIDEDRSIH